MGFNVIHEFFLIASKSELNSSTMKLHQVPKGFCNIQPIFFLYPGPGPQFFRCMQLFYIQREFEEQVELLFSSLLLK